MPGRFLLNCQCHLEDKTVSSLRPSTPEPLENQPDLPGRTHVLEKDYKVAAALAYTPVFLINVIFSVIWLKTEQNSSFLKFHALQSLTLTAGLFVAGIGVGMLSLILAFIPLINTIVPVINFFWGLVVLAYFGVNIMLAYKAYKGVAYKLPYIGDFATQKAQEI